jgi:hypothetical protein
MSFVIERVCGSARAGLFMGKLATPCLLPFTRKGLPPALIHDDLKALDVQAVIIGAGDALEQRRWGKASVRQCESVTLGSGVHPTSGG